MVYVISFIRVFKKQRLISEDGAAWWSRDDKLEVTASCTSVAITHAGDEELEGIEVLGFAPFSDVGSSSSEFHNLL